MLSRHGKDKSETPESLTLLSPILYSTTVVLVS